MDYTNSQILLDKIVDWRSIIDIFLLSIVLFLLYRTIVRLGTWKIVIGILIAMCFFLLANVIGLKGIEWIYNNLSQVAVIALIVIFQPELRKMFERTVSVRRSGDKGMGDEISELLAESLLKMAKQRCGAIIVFPGKEPIQEWVSGGIVMDAKPSMPLILSMFDPRSPGHDGAMVIENGKITRYSVRLPLSQSSRMPEEYGTRHHAAMGIVEKSDALAIVVSEERGKISIFRSGGFRPANGRDEIKGIIQQHWTDTISYPNLFSPGRNSLSLCGQYAATLAVALLIWSTLIFSQIEIIEKVFSVPVEYTTTSNNLVLVGEKEKKVRIHLSGSKSDLNLIKPLQVNAKIDISKASAGKQNVLITADNFHLPRGVKLLDVVPSNIELNLAELTEQEVAIKAQLIGEPPNGLTIRNVKVFPEKVSILYPKTDHKSKIESLSTTPIYLDSIQENTKVFCKLIAPPSVQPKDKKWPEVEVFLTFDRK